MQNTWKALSSRHEAKKIVTDYELSKANNQKPEYSEASYVAALMVLKYVKPQCNTYANMNVVELF